MGAFNILKATTNCPLCGKEGQFEIQFKYGDTWQYVYNVGDELKWGKNDIGVPGCKSIEGIGGPCLYCDSDGIEFEILLHFDVVTEVKSINA